MRHTTHSKIVCGALCAMLVSAGAALGQGAAPAAPTPPIPPEAPAATAHSSTAWSMSRTEKGRTVKIDGRDGKITAEIDGKAVPADRIERDGSSVRILDDQGVVVFDEQVMEPDTITIIQSVPGMSGSWGGGTVAPLAPNSPRRSARHMYTWPQGQASVLEPVEQPRIMIGVQLIEPDASLRGHFGLKENETTLVSAVYEGLPANAAGLEPYDIIISIDGKSPASPEVVRKALREKDAGQSVQLEVLHQGQRKTVTLTPEKYDREKMDKAKVNAIAATAGEGSNVLKDYTVAVAPMAPGQAWAGTSPMIGAFRTPDGKSRNQVFWKMDEDAAKVHQDLARQAEEMAREMERQAEKWRTQMERSSAGSPFNQQMDDRMKRLEELLKQMMERQGKPAEQPKSEKQSGLMATRRTMS